MAADRARDRGAAAGGAAGRRGGELRASRLGSLAGAAIPCSLNGIRGRPGRDEARA